MGWKPEKWKFSFRGSKDAWLVVLAVGLIFLILAFPVGGKKKNRDTGTEIIPQSQPSDSAGPGDYYPEPAQDGSRDSAAYERQLESRLKELLSHVEGVGEVEVMIVLNSSEEKVWRWDQNSSYSSTRETDSGGGTRDIRSQEVAENTILTGQNGGEGPLLEKELRPEIGGVVVSASGGGSPAIQAEISAAVEALFDVPSHKIKVLKRAE